ncbi:MAG: hypothetical protein J6X55_05370 [Victivallales bacterium]|nr:hypothetical protein [Victivallales bacterium]
MKQNDSDLFFTCSLIELMARNTRQRRGDLVTLLGRKIVSHIYSYAGVLHCEPIAKTAETFIDLCHVPQGDFDNVASCKYTVPTYWDIGKVYARLIQDVCDGNLVETLFRVYTSSTSDCISNYNSDFFYQSRDFIKEYFLSGESVSIGDFS